MSLYKTISEIQAGLVKLTRELQIEKEQLMRASGSKKLKKELKLIYYTDLINHVFKGLHERTA
jgi:hypothetical protein